MPPDPALAKQIATAVGENAITVFGSALLVLMLSAGASWLILHRLYVRRRDMPETADARAWTATLVLGFIAILLAALVFATLPGWIGITGLVGVADQALTDAMRRTVTLPVLQMFAAFTALADPATLWLFAIAGAGVLLWRRQYSLAGVWIAAIAGNGILTRVLKAVFARARPTHEHELLAVQGWSFPSGHSSGAVVAYGILAYVLIRRTAVVWHLPIVLLAAAIAFIVGCSRIFLQVHYASDVLAGFACGLAWLAVCVIAAEFGRRRSLG